MLVGTSVVLVQLENYPALNGRVGLVTEILEGSAWVSLRDAFSNEILFWEVEKAPQVELVKTHVSHLRFHTTAVLGDVPRRPVWHRTKRKR